MDLLDIIGKAVRDQEVMVRIQRQLDGGAAQVPADDVRQLLALLHEERNAPDESNLSEACRLLANIHTRTSMTGGDRFSIVDRAPVIGVHWIDLRDYFASWAILRKIARI